MIQFNEILKENAAKLLYVIIQNLFYYKDIVKEY